MGEKMTNVDKSFVQGWPSESLDEILRSKWRLGD